MQGENLETTLSLNPTKLITLYSDLSISPTVLGVFRRKEPNLQKSLPLYGPFVQNDYFFVYELLVHSTGHNVLIIGKDRSELVTIRDMTKEARQ